MSLMDSPRPTLNPYTVKEIARAAGMANSTTWKRVRRLALNGVVERRVKIGGPGGTVGLVLFPGTLTELVHRVATLPKAEPNGKPKLGAPCPNCHRPVELRGPKCAYCPACRRGWLRERDS